MSTAPRGRASASVLVSAIGLACAACGSPPPAATTTPAASAPPKLQVVEADAPFIVDWGSPDLASLAAAVRSPNAGGVVVSYQRNVMRILPDCHLAGAYVPSSIGMYRGLLQVRRADSMASAKGARVEALQQTATSENVAEGAANDYRFVIVGRHYLRGNRPDPTVRDLASRSNEGCRGATHYVRAALTGAFERTGGGDPRAPLPVGAPLPKDGKAPLHGGDFTACMMAGTAATPACDAFVKIEIAPVLPAPAADSPPSATTSAPVTPTAAPTVAPQIVIPKPGDPQKQADPKPTGPAPAPTQSAPPAPNLAPTTAPQINVPKPPASADPAPTSAPSAPPENKAPENKAP